MTTKVKPPFVRNPYNYDMNEAGDESGLLCKDPSLAQQSFTQESDINFIAERYGLTGEMPEVLQLPTYGDFTGIFDFQSAQNAVRQALNDFMTLPAKMRARFNNDPQQLIQFLDNPDNRDEAEFLGLVPKPVQAAPQSPLGNAGGAGQGDTLSLAPKPPAEPSTAPTDNKTKPT